jgi:hypothetical protein
MIINMESWILQDGNYTDFEKGQVRKFALEFNPKELRKSTKQIKECTSLGEGRYRVNAQVVYLETEVHPCIRVCYDDKQRVVTQGEYDETVVILDLGGVMAFDESHHDYYERGGFVEGEIYVAIDPFFYKDDHCKRPGIPALIYSWNIDKIEMCTAPYLKTIEMLHGQKRKILRRDKTKMAYKEIDKTSMWEDDNGRADYLLTCSKL